MVKCIYSFFELFFVVLISCHAYRFNKIKVFGVKSAHSFQTASIDLLRNNFMHLSASASELPKQNRDVNDANMKRELDIFFERASEQGSSFAKKLTPAERAERAILGEELEDKIFDIQETISSLSRQALEGDQQAIDDIKRLRDEMNTLKQDYISLVGGNELPIYFGRNPDSFQ